MIQQIFSGHEFSLRKILTKSKEPVKMLSVLIPDQKTLFLLLNQGNYGKTSAYHRYTGYKAEFFPDNTSV
ncbi:MAG: hypothetical protein B6244_01165 [Candidatus Cloacimonetes bacterium 4572_55]|nr:MAG: hypothetical protein B6244_01165 [Candidatus Cloacimonetes bacterium 4572_55]